MEEVKLTQEEKSEEDGVVEEDELEEHPEEDSHVAELTDKLTELQVRKEMLPSQGTAGEIEKEYTPPVGYEPPDKSDPRIVDTFRTPDDAVVAFLREEIDEDVLSQVISKLGKPSVGEEESRNRIDVGFSRQLPKWVFPTPRNVVTTVDEMIQVMAIEQEEREAAQELELLESASPYAGNETKPNPM